MARTQVRKRKSARASRTTKLVIGGEVRTFHTIRADSKNFSSELQKAFKRSVSKARRDNKRLLGSSDFVPRNG